MLCFTCEPSGSDGDSLPEDQPGLGSPEEGVHSENPGGKEQAFAILLCLALPALIAHLALLGLLGHLAHLAPIAHLAFPALPALLAHLAHLALCRTWEWTRPVTTL